MALSNKLTAQSEIKRELIFDSECVQLEVSSSKSLQQRQPSPPERSLLSGDIKSEQVDPHIPVSLPKCVSRDVSKFVTINGEVLKKEKPTCSGDECHCAECRGEVVIKGERHPIDDEIVSDY